MINTSEYVTVSNSSLLIILFEQSREMSSVYTGGISREKESHSAVATTTLIPRKEHSWNRRIVDKNIDSFKE